MTTTTTLTNPIASVDSQPDGTVLLTFRGPWKDSQCDSINIILTPNAAQDLLADLANQARHSVYDVLQDLSRGPCELCNNRRLVDFEKNGRTTNRYCDCTTIAQDVNTMISQATFPMRATHHAYDGKTTLEVVEDES